MDIDRRFLSGEWLYGDSFDDAECRAWLEAEVDGFESLSHIDSREPVDLYSELSAFYFFRQLQAEQFGRVLCLGPGWGEELSPIKHLIGRLTVIEPSSSYRAYIRRQFGSSCQCYSSLEDLVDKGSDARYDLVICFGVLHHIARVTKTLESLYRLMAVRGVMIIREPITSMGDWTKPRRGLTKNERGLPFKWLRQTAKNIGFEVAWSKAIGFAPSVRIGRSIIGDGIWNRSSFVLFDSLVSRCYPQSWLRYHRTSVVHKLAPSIGVWKLVK